MRSLVTAEDKVRDRETGFAHKGQEARIDFLLKDCRVEVVDVHIAEGVLQLTRNDEEVPKAQTPE